MKFENLVVRNGRKNVRGAGEDQGNKFSIDGRNEDGNVTFVKQYSGEWTHAIYYQGELSEDGLTLKGFWGYEPGTQEASFSIQK